MIYHKLLKRFFESHIFIKKCCVKCVVYFLDIHIDVTSFVIINLFCFDLRNLDLYWKLIKEAFQVKADNEIPHIQFTSDDGINMVAF